MTSFYALTLVLSSLLAAISICSATVVASPVELAPVQPDVCFTRSQDCCYKYKSCGTETSSVVKDVACPYERCTTSCQPACEQSSSIRPVSMCDGSEVPSCDKNSCNGVCTEKFVTETTPKVCKEVCGIRKCTLVQRTCKRTEVRTFTKFCGVLSCGVFKGTPETAKPIKMV